MMAHPQGAEHARIVAPQSAKDAPSSLDDWMSKKAGTESLLKLLQTYKDLGDSKSEVGAQERGSASP